MEFKDVITFTQNPNYRTNVEWRGLEAHIERWSERVGGLASLDLNPDFQREHVWTPEQQTKYVEYVLAGGRSGLDIYFNCAGWQGSYKGPFVIVDGKQRLRAAREFMANRVPVFNGQYYKDFTGYLRADFVLHVNDLATRQKVLKWYLEMNTGGTPHTADEINKVKQMMLECK